MNIRVHKKINSNHITLGKESLVNTFYGLVELYNKQDIYKDLELTKQRLWELAGYQGTYDSSYIKELIKELTQAKPFDVSSLNKVGITSISGSMFVITSYNDGRLVVEVPKGYQRLLFYKKDLDLMSKAKKKLKMSVEELDHWDRETKEKSKFLVLLKKADLLHIQGKYNKRLYALLMQWSYTGTYKVKYQEFKEILEIPKSYQSTNIDKRIFEPAKKELFKVGVKITRITKKKEGRSITGIKINFKLVEEEKKDEPKQLQGVEPKKEKPKELKKEIREPNKSELLEFKGEVEKIAEKQLKDKVRLKIFKSVLKIASSFEQVNSLVVEYSLNRTIEGTEPQEKEKIPSRPERKKVHSKRLISDIRSDIDFFGKIYRKGKRKKADLVETLLDLEEEFNN